MDTDEMIIAYCSSKGYAIQQGAAAVDTLREQLAQENNGMIHPAFADDTYLDLGQVLLTDIVQYNPHHYAEVEPRPVVANDENTPAIAGVLYERGYANYGLVDGYHRFKWLKEHKQESGLYIVLKNSGLSR